MRLSRMRCSWAGALVIVNSTYYNTAGRAARRPRRAALPCRRSTQFRKVCGGRWLDELRQQRPRGLPAFPVIMSVASSKARSRRTCRCQRHQVRSGPQCEGRKGARSQVPISFSARRRGDRVGMLFAAVHQGPQVAQAVWKGVVSAPLLVRLRFRDHGAPI